LPIIGGRGPCTAAYLVAWAAAGCVGVTEVQPPPPPPPPASIVLAVVPDGEDAAAAAALQWEAGVPGAEVRVRLASSNGSFQSFVSDAQGKVAISGVPSGQYAIEVDRWLTQAERGRLPVGNTTAGFALKTIGQLGPGAQVTLTVPGSRRSGVVISEWSYAPIWSPGTGSYEFGGYLELANIGDTTAFLDGMLLGEAWTQGVDFASPGCAAISTVTNDPTGVWGRRLARFPGTGRQYPVPPGGVRVIATDAIDHRPLTPGGIDLSRADFEFLGPQDVDNPSVPNLQDVGLFASHFGHGMDFDNLWSVPFLAKSLDPTTLVRQRQPFFSSGDELLKVNASDLLDVAAFLSTYEFPLPLCPQLVSPAIDRRAARLIGESNAASQAILSIHRLRPPGQPFLQDTRTSAVDFVSGPRTPGALP